MVKEPTCDSIASPYPYVVVDVALNPTQIAISIPANTNIEQKTTYNIHILYWYYSNQTDKILNTYIIQEYIAQEIETYVWENEQQY